MFRGKPKAFAGLDWTSVLAEDDIVVPAAIADVGIIGDVQTLAYDAVQGLLAVGTKLGYLYITGQNGVYTSWQLHGSSSIKHLAFKAGAGLLCAIDGRDTLHVFDLLDLDPEQRPKRLCAWSARSTVTCIECSPAHAHLILGLRDGTVDFYDLDRHHPSPYRIPNMWLPQEELLRRSGVMNAPARRHIPMCVDIKQHPLDLNRLFIAYEGGIVLWNLRDRQVEQMYELVIPPGALGGGNDREEAQLSERRPSITCMTLRPDGLILVAGTEDGCLSFWAIDDGDRPLFVRTIDREYVDRIDVDSVFAGGREDRQFEGMREPVFKIAWSGFPDESVFDKVAAYTTGQSDQQMVDKPRGTALSILGGLLPSDIKGVHVLHFAPPALGLPHEPPHAVLEKSLRHDGHSVYDTPLPPEDFLLITRSPHYCGAYDPFAIIAVQSPHTTDSSKSNKRSLQAWAFPPSLTSVPTRLTLPAALHCALSPLTFELFTTSSLVLQRLLHAASEHLGRRLSIEGGFASARCPKSSKPDGGKRTEARLLLALLPGLRIQLSDISSPLLVGENDSTVSEDFPSPLFDIDVAQVLTDPRCDRLLAFRLLKETPELLSVRTICFAPETSELVLALSTGEIVIGRIEISRALPLPHDHMSPVADESDPALVPTASPPPVSPPVSPALSGEDKHRRSVSRIFRTGPKHRKRNGSIAQTSPHASAHLEVVDLDGAAWDGFRLLCGVIGAHYAPDALGSSEVGFVAIAFPGRLVVVDLRGPDVVIDEAMDPTLGAVRLLTWTIAPFEEDQDLAPRLIASHQSGTTQIYSLRHSLETWVCAGPPIVFEHDPHSDPLMCRVLSPRGDVLSADADALQDALRGYRPHSHTSLGISPSYLLLVSAKAAAIKSSPTEARVAKIDFDEQALAAEVVSRHEASLLAVLAVDGVTHLFTLPQLQPLQRIPSPIHLEGVSGLWARFAPDGDMALFDPSESGIMHFRTLFGRSRAVSPPSLSLHDASVRIPARPTVSVLASMQGGMAGLAAWMRGPATLTGDTFDSLIAGPNRPLPKKERVAQISALARKSRDPPRSSKAGNTIESWQKWAMGESQQQASSAQSAVAETNEMLEEREDRLTQLNEGLSDMGRGAANMLKEAKQFAANEAIKNRLGALFH